MLAPPKPTGWIRQWSTLPILSVSGSLEHTSLGHNSRQGRIQGGGCRGWQPLPNGNWRPCAEGVGVLFSSPFDEYLSPRSIFCIKGVIWAPFYQRRRSSDTKRRSFRPRKRPSKQTQHPIASRGALLARKDAFSL